MLGDIPVVLLAMVALGYAERGAIASLPCIVLLPVLLLTRPDPRWLLPGGVVVGGLAAAATYLGVASPQLPPAPDAQRPAGLATDACLGAASCGSSTTRRFGGTGLGLAISQHLVG